MLGNSYIHISTKSQPTFTILSTDKMLGKKVCCVLQCPWQVIGFDTLDHIPAQECWKNFSALQCWEH